MAPFNFSVNDVFSSRPAKIIAGGIGVAISAAGVVHQNVNKTVKLQNHRREATKEFLRDPNANYKRFARDQLEVEATVSDIEEDFTRHAKKHNLAENKHLALKVKGSLFGQERLLPLLERPEVFLVNQEDMLNLAKPLPERPSDSTAEPLFSSVPPNSPPSSASITSFFNFRQTKEKESSSLFEQPIDEQAVNEAISRYRAGKPVGEDQRYIVVSSFKIPSRFERDPAGEAISLALWIVLIVSLLSIIRTVFGLVKPIWQRSFYSSLENRLNPLQNRQLQIVSNQEFRDIAYGLQRGAIEAYVAYSTGRISRDDCRQRMTERFLVMPEIVEMLLYYIDSGVPLPDFVEKSFRNALTSNGVDDSPIIRQPLSSAKSLRIPPPPPPPPPLPPHLAAFPKHQLSGKSFMSCIKSVVFHTRVGFRRFSQILPEIQLLLVCLIIVFVSLFWLS